MNCPHRFRAPLDPPRSLDCERPEGHPGAHSAVVRDYAYPGSETHINWYSDDRRDYTGNWAPCQNIGCILPVSHHGACVS